MISIDCEAIARQRYETRVENINDADCIEWSRQCFLNSYQDAPRPSVHEHFLMQAFVVALRSEDIHTKHGAIIVENATNHQIGSGYNACFRGMEVDDDILQRPEKYAWMIHAEENAIMNCTKNPLSLTDGARIYITGMPCNNCLQRVINFGIRHIYIANRRGTALESDETRARQTKILTKSGAIITQTEMSNPWLKRVTLG